MAGPVKDEMEKVVLAAAEDGRFDVVLFVYNFIQKDQGERIIRACRDRNMGVTLMKTNPIKFVTDIETMYNRAVEAGRKIGDQFITMMDEYRAHAAKGEAFKKKCGLQTTEQVNTVRYVSHRAFLGFR